MQIAYKSGSVNERRIYVKDINADMLQVIRDMGFVYNKQIKAFEALRSLQLVTALEKYIRLPQSLLKLKEDFIRVQNEMDTERLSSRPVPLLKPPVKANLYEHQIRALNMALLHFGVVEE